MPKISVSDFVRTANTSQMLEQARRLQEHKVYLERCRRTGESSTQGAGMLLMLASLSAAMDGLPDCIALGSSNGYRQGLVAVMQGGHWRLDGPDNTISSLYSTGMPDARGIVYPVIDSLKLDRSGDVATRLEAVAGWKDAARPLEKTMEAALEYLEPHVVRAVVSNRGEIMRTLGIRTGTVAHWIAPCWKACELFGREHLAVDADGEQGVLAGAAAAGDIATLFHLLDPDNIPEGRTGPNLVTDGIPALRAACSRVQEDTMAILIRAGVNVESVDGAGWSMLHMLAQGCSLERWGQDGANAASMLMDAGADPQATDVHGKTASDILEERRRSAVRDGRLEDDSSTHPLLELLSRRERSPGT